MSSHNYRSRYTAANHNNNRVANAMTGVGAKQHDTQLTLLLQLLELPEAGLPHLRPEVGGEGQEVLVG